MSDHIEDISPEEERAARLTAFVLGELDEHEAAEVEVDIDEFGSEECDRLRPLVDEVSKLDHADTLPEPSDSIRDAIESRLAQSNAKVELTQTTDVASSRQRLLFVCATGLSLLLVIAAVSSFSSNDLAVSLLSKDEIAEQRQVNSELRKEAERADDRLAIEHAAKRIALAELESRQELLTKQLAQQATRQESEEIAVAKQQLTDNIQQLAALDAEVQKLRKEIRTAQQDRDFRAADAKAKELVTWLSTQVASETQQPPNVPSSQFTVVPKQVTVDAKGMNPSTAVQWGTQPNGPVHYAPVKPPQSTPPPQVVVDAYIRPSGSWAYQPQNSPPPNQLAAGPNARGAGTAVINYGRTVSGQRVKQIVPSNRGGQVRRLKEVAELQRLYKTEQKISAPRFALGLVRDGAGGEQYSAIVENRFLSTRDEPLSTFSIDVDTASYANARRFISQNQMPPVDSVRLEEFVNYFKYDYAEPTGDEPFAVDIEVAQCPWQEKHQLVRVGLKGKEVPQKERPSSNVVFLLDVSGSMQDANKLPLLKQAMKLLTSQLTESDRVSIVTYAGNAGLALDTTNGENEQTICDAIDALNANGSTNGSAGIQLAYEKATESFIKDGANRVILATDGDLNVGVTDDDALVELIKEKAGTGVFLTVLGFGEGNLKDGKLEKLADNGNGMYAYIDSLREARKVLVEQIAGSLVTIAKDVKIKVEFNPAEVSAYRLLGYENRLMAAPDFDNDAKDAGEIGAGHTVTAMYEIVPAGASNGGTETTSSLKYQQTVNIAPGPPKELTDAAKTGELLTLFLRHKKPDANESTLTEFVVKNEQRAFDEASDDFRFAAAVASFGMLLRKSKYQGNTSFARVEEIASSAIGTDSQGHRTEFVDLVRKANALQPQRR